MDIDYWVLDILKKLSRFFKCAIITLIIFKNKYEY